MNTYKSIMLVGCGGVGAPLAIHLGNVTPKLVLIDHDIYELHNMHRQPLAKGRVGASKVDCLAEAIGPMVKAKIVPVEMRFTTECGADLLKEYEPELIVIAVDNDEARKALWSYKEHYDILWAANEVWDPQAGISLKEKPWNPMEEFKPAETVEHPICGTQSIHANCTAASLASYLLMCHLTEKGKKPVFISKSEDQPPFLMYRDEIR